MCNVIPKQMIPMSRFFLVNQNINSVTSFLTLGLRKIV